MEGSVMAPSTFTFDVASGMLGELLAWITVVPVPIAVTGTDTELVPGVKVTEAGTVATPAFVELRLMVTPGGATAERFRVRFSVPSLIIVVFCWVKATVAVTCTEELAGVNPLALAVMLAAPRLTPVTVGWVGGALCPAAMVTLAGEIVTRDVSLLASTTVTDAAAGVERLTGKGIVWPSPSAPPAGTTILTALCTFTPTVALAIPVAAGAAAVIVALPTETAVTGTLTMVAPAAKLRLAGTVATAVLPELRFTVSPPAGAAEDKLSGIVCVVSPLMATGPAGKFITAVTCTALLPLM